MELLPIKEKLEDNDEFSNNPLCSESLPMSIDFYNRVGYVPPWIGYYVKRNNELVASIGFKGPPVNNTIEIAYGVFEPYQRQGIGTTVCKMLVELALNTDATIIITARTFSENNFSTRILEKNNFLLHGPVQDPEDGEVWEWIYQNPISDF
ncbi:MAG: GNAT family protein [Saprospiraceae bacterium]